LILSKKLFLASAVLFVLASLSFIGSVGASSEMWSQTYGGADQEVAHSLVETSDGGYALAGYTNSSGAGHDDFWLVKTDANGNMEWNQTYDSWYDHANSMVETSDGGYAIAGSTGWYFSGIHDFWLVKTDANGKMEWNQTYGESEEEVAYSLVETSDGGYALAGVTDSFGAGNYDFWVIKTDINGNMEWNKTYGGAESDVAFSLIETSDGGFAIAGYTGSFGAGDYDFWLIKTDEHGIIPEFPSWTILPLLLATTLTVIIYRKKLYKTQTQQSY